MKHIPVTKAIPNFDEAQRELAFIVQDFERAGLVEGTDWGWIWGQPHARRPEGWHLVRYDLKKVRNKTVPKAKTEESRHRKVNVYE